MQDEIEAALQRWCDARLLDADTAERIRAFESSDATQRRARWPVIVAVTFGALMLAVGVVLFVSAHWDQLSPAQRMSTLIVMVAGLHSLAALASERNQAVGYALHAAGTLSLGAAIAVAGQIFNMQEHWPSAILVWAAGACMAWFLLRHWSQLAIAAILTPAWLVSEWIVAAGPGASSQVPAAGHLICAFCYLSARFPGHDSSTRRSLVWIGGLALLPSAVGVAIAHTIGMREGQPTDLVVAIGWFCAVAVPLGFAFVLRGRRVWMNVAAAGWVLLLVWLGQERFEIAVYLWCVVGAAGLVAWGIHELRAERINLGMAGFAITLVTFFFSNVMDKLGRSASLIVMGVLFLAGGWYWEKLRRRLVAQTKEANV